MSKSKKSNINTNKNSIKIIINNETKKRKRKSKKYDGKSKHHTQMGQPVQPMSQAISSSGLVRIPRNMTIGSARLPDDLSALSIEYLKPKTVIVTPKDVETPIAPAPPVKLIKDAPPSSVPTPGGFDQGEKEDLMSLNTKELKKAIKAYFPSFKQLHAVNQTSKKEILDDLFRDRATRRFSDIDDDDAKVEFRAPKTISKRPPTFVSQEPFSTGPLSNIGNTTATTSGEGVMDILNDDSWLNTGDENDDLPDLEPTIAPNVTVRTKKVPQSPEFYMDLSEVPPATKENRRESFIPDQTASHEAPVVVPVPKISQKEILKKRLAEDREKKMQDQSASTQPIIAPTIAKVERTSTPIKARRVSGSLTLNDDDAQSVSLTPAQESKAFRESERNEARAESDLLAQIMSKPMSGPTNGNSPRKPLKSDPLLNEILKQQAQQAFSFEKGNKITVPVDLSQAEQVSSHPFASSLVQPKRRPSFTGATASGLPVPPPTKNKSGGGGKAKPPNSIILG